MILVAFGDIVLGFCNQLFPESVNPSIGFWFQSAANVLPVGKYFHIEVGINDGKVSTAVCDSVHFHDCSRLSCDCMLASLASAGYGIVHIANADDLDLALAFLAIRSERTRLRICGLGFT